MNYKIEYEKWKKISFLPNELKSELSNISGDEKKIIDSFSDYVSFGTAGMRGTMGVGPGKMNIFTIRRATLGIAKYIINHKKENSGVVITHDSRINSRKFAEYIASVFSEFGIKVYITKDLRPTPFLSFAVRELKTFAGINVTASHNKKTDNGYKVYLDDGAQFSPPRDKEIIDLVNSVSDDEIFVDPKDCKPNKSFINYVPKSVEDKFMDGAYSCMIHKNYCKKYGNKLKVVYTPLHGTGYIFLEKLFKRAGFTNVKVVKEQNDRCGLFKTVDYPNPEVKEAFILALKYAKKIDADIVVATDPDADRMGVYVRQGKGNYIALSGNELPSIIFKYVAHYRNINRKNTFCVKSFVTTRLLDIIGKDYGIDVIECPTGFKWMGKEILNNKKKLILGTEESYGALLSDYVRDKDAIGTTLLVLEIALVLKNAGFTLYEMLKMLYNYYGVCKNYSFSIIYEGVEGKKKMDGIMESLRNNPIRSLSSIKVTKVYDYKTNIVTDLIKNTKKKFKFDSTNTIKYILSDNTTLTIRPSGTEPKIKIYFDLLEKSEEKAFNKYNKLEKEIRKKLT